MIIDDSNNKLLTNEGKRIKAYGYSDSELRNIFTSSLKLNENQLNNANTGSANNPLSDLLCVLLSTKDYKRSELCDISGNLKLSTSSLSADVNQDVKAKVANILKLAKTADLFDDPSKLQGAVYQFIPEIFEALSTHLILDIRRDVIKSVTQCVSDSLNRDHQNVRLTDGSTSCKVAWYLGGTLVKVALNIVTMGIGSAFTDAIHSALQTHGASAFDLNKVTVTMKDIDGSDGRVSVRRPTQWNRKVPPKAILNQCISDLNDQMVQDAQGKLSGSYIDNLYKYFNEKIDGKKIDKVPSQPVLELLFIPIEILTRRLDTVEVMIRRVALDVIVKYSALDPDCLNKLDSVKKIAEIVQINLRDLRVHAYITNLTHLARTYIECYDWKLIYKVMMAEMLAANGLDVLKSGQTLSDGLWEIIDKHGFAITGSPSGFDNNQIDLKNYLTPFLADKKSWNNSYSDALKNDNQTVMSYQFKYNISQDLLATTSKKKFGYRSTLASLSTCQFLVDDVSKDLKSTIKELIEESSYVAYSNKIGIPSTGHKVWDNVKGAMDWGMDDISKKYLNI